MTTAYTSKTNPAAVADTWIEKMATLTELQELATEWGLKPDGNSRWRKSYFAPIKAERDRLLESLATETAARIEVPIAPVEEVAPAPEAPPVVEDLQETIAKLRLYSALDSALIVDDKALTKATLKALRDKHGIELKTPLNKSWEVIRPEAERVLWAHKYRKRPAPEAPQAPAVEALQEVETAPQVTPAEDVQPPEVEAPQLAQVIPFSGERVKGVVVLPPDRPQVLEFPARRLSAVSLVSKFSQAPSDRLSASLRQRMGATAIALYNAAKGRITPQRAIALSKLLSSPTKGVIAA